jgi:uncharacterized membrane protein
MTDSPSNARTEVAREAGESAYRRTVDVVLTGLAIVLPLVVTIYVLQIAVNFIRKAFQPFIGLLQWIGVITAFEELWVGRVLQELGIYRDVFAFLTELIAAIVLVGAIVGIGFLAHLKYGELLIGKVDDLLVGIPGFGTLYKSFRRMGDAMVESDVDNFREVRLVEYPRRGTYLIGFETSKSPEAVHETLGEDEMMTLFLPLAPNPVMGGFLAHIPADRVHDVDMTVEEGIRTVITSGIAAGEESGSVARGETVDLSRFWRREQTKSPKSD